MKTLKKLLALSLTFVLALSLSGCGGKTYTSVMTINEMNIPSGLYLLTQYNAYNTASMKVSNPKKNILGQKVEGVNAKKWIESETQKELLRFAAVETLAKKHSIVLTSEEKSKAEQNTSTYWSVFEASYLENGIARTTVYKYQENQLVGQLLFGKLYGKNGELALADEELKTLYEEKYAHIRYVSIPLTDEANLPISAPEDAIAAAEKVLETIKSGISLEDAAKTEVPKIYEYLPKAFDETLADTELETSYVEYDAEKNTTYPEEFLTSLAADSIGEFGIFTSETSILLYEKIKTFETDAEFDERRDSVVSDVCLKPYEDYLEEQAASYEVKKVFGAQFFYRPSKINKS